MHGDASGFAGHLAQRRERGIERCERSFGYAGLARAGHQPLRQAGVSRGDRGAREHQRPGLVGRVLKAGDVVLEEAGDGENLTQMLSVLAAETVCLVLTRNKQQLRHARPISVEAELARDEALALLASCAAGSAPAPILEDIYAVLGGHPLALTWSGRQLAAREETPAAFLVALRGEALREAALPGLNEPGKWWLTTISRLGEARVTTGDLIIQQGDIAHFVVY